MVTHYLCLPRRVVKKFPVALLGSGAPLNCLMKYAGSLDPAARCGKPYIWPQMWGCGGEVRGGGCRACTLTWPLTSHSRATPCEGPQGFGPRAPIFAPSATDRPLHHPGAPLGPWLHAARSFLACGSARSAVVRCGTPAGRKSPKATRTQRAERGARISRHSWRLQREAYASARAVLLRSASPCPGHPREAS